MRILLDYVFKITRITPTPAASTAFLKQVCLVVKPKAPAVAGTIHLCTNMTQVEALTDNTNAQEFFSAGMSRVYLLLADNLDMESVLESENRFYTLVISDDFDDNDLGVPVITQASLVVQDITYTAVPLGEAGNDVSIEYADTNTDGEASVSVVGQAITVSIESGVTTAATILAAIEESVSASALVTGEIAEGQEAATQVTAALDNLEGGAETIEGDISTGSWEGVIGLSTTSTELAFVEAKKENRCCFLTIQENGAQNLCYAFGSLLSNANNWRNQQYITMPGDDEIVDLGVAELLFDERVSFVITDAEFSQRLAFFVAGGRAIIAPYIIKNLCIDLQSRALQWISANQPDYTLKEASLLESRLQEDVIAAYVRRGWLTGGTVTIGVEADNFIASGDIQVPTPKALWRVASELRESI